MKSLIFTFALFAANVSYATNYNFKQSLFSMNAVVKNSATNPATTTPAFNLSGYAMWIEDADGNELPKAQITIRRTTYDCDDVTYSYNDTYSCNLQGDKFQQILEDVATHDEHFLAAQAIIKKYFDDAPYYETLTIPLGTLNQANESTEHTELADPINHDITVDIELKTTGMIPL